MSNANFLDPGSWLGSATPFHAFRVQVILVREGSPGTYPTFTSSGAVYRMFRSLCDLDREVFLSLLLDAKQRLTGVGLVSVGTLDASLVHPREVFKPAVVGNAASVICLHNHPSGSPAASRESRIPKTRRFARENPRVGEEREKRTCIIFDSEAG